MKKRFTSIAVLCAAVLITGCNSANESGVADSVNKAVLSADYPYYDSIDKLSDRANVIVCGMITGAQVEEINDAIPEPGNEASFDSSVTAPHIYTVYTVELIDVYKGDYKQGDVMEIRQLGGAYSGVDYQYDGFIDFTEETEYVFFLKQYEGFPANLLNPIQSCYIYPAAGEKAGDRSQVSEDVILESINPINDLVLSQEDLLKIQGNP